MRASVDPLRNRAVNLIEIAKDQAEEALLAGEERLRGAIDASADRATSRVDHVAGQVPVVTITKRAGGSRKRIVMVLLLVAVVGAVIWSARRKAPPAAGTNTSPAPAPSTSIPTRAPNATDADSHFRVVPTNDGAWEIVGPGQAAVHHRTQASAIEHAKELARGAGGGEIVIHGMDGNPRDTLTV